MAIGLDQSAETGRCGRLIRLSSDVRNVTPALAPACARAYQQVIGLLWRLGTPEARAMHTPGPHAELCQFGEVEGGLVAVGDAVPGSLVLGGLSDRARFWSRRWRAYEPVTRRDPNATSRVCHGVEQIEGFGTTDEPILIATRQYGFRVDGSKTLPPREVNGWLVIAHKSPVRMVSLKYINGLGFAEVKGRRVSPRRAEAAPDLIDSDKRFDVIARRHCRS